MDTKKFERFGELIGYMIIAAFVILFWVAFIKLLVWWI